jgi:hypothetical protein
LISLPFNSDGLAMALYLDSHSAFPSLSASTPAPASPWPAPPLACRGTSGSAPASSACPVWPPAVQAFLGVPRCEAEEEEEAGAASLTPPAAPALRSRQEGAGEEEDEEEDPCSCLSTRSRHEDEVDAARTIWPRGRHR